MRVLEHACRLCRSGGLVLDLTTIPPAASLEVGMSVLGRLEQTAWLEHAASTETAVDEAVAAGVLDEEAAVDFDVLKHFEAGADAIEDVDADSATRLPDELRTKLEGVSTPLVKRSRCRLRRLRLR